MSTETTGPETAEVSSHSNVVTLNDLSGTITGVSYVNDSLVISEGQPSSPPPSITRDGGAFKIDLGAGRHKTTAVADGFNTLSGGRYNEYAPSGDGGTPGQLNFFFAVQIQFQVQGVSAGVEVYLGQGSYGLTNNWWLGGANVSNYGTPRLVFTAGDSEVTLSLSGDRDTFNLRLASVRPVSPIKNVFVLMLENHSFDNVFARSGIPGIDAAGPDDHNSYGGIAYYVHGEAPPSMPTDPGHEFTDVVQQLAGYGKTYPPGGPYPAIDNSGFAANYATTTTEGKPPAAWAVGDIMACFDTPSQLPITYQLATQFAVCDHWFSSLPGPTWPNRFFVHGASSAGLDHSPSTAEMIEWETVRGFTYPHGSIYDALNAAGVSHHLFIDADGPLAGSVPQVASLHNVSVLDVHPLDDFVSLLQGGNYPYQYTFIEPNYGDVTSTYEGGSSQHPMDGVARGEQLIQTVYEAIRNSNVWESSLLIITYDEHGGFYDHCRPGQTSEPADGSSNKYNKYGFTFDQLGVRVPAVVVSPWVGQGVVDDTVYDHSSVLATVETLFGLKPLTQRDAHASSVLDLITGTLRTDCPTSLGRPAPEPVRPALTAAQQMVLDRQPLPESGNVHGFLAIMTKTELELSAGTPAAREDIVARLAAIRTRGEARAYIESVMTRAAAVRGRLR